VQPEPVPLVSRFEERYEILGELGSGGFGRVYQARQLSTGQSVAIRVLSTRAGAEESTGRRVSVYAWSNVASEKQHRRMAIVSTADLHPQCELRSSVIPVHSCGSRDYTGMLCGKRNVSPGSYLRLTSTRRLKFSA